MLLIVECIILVLHTKMHGVFKRQDIYIHEYFFIYNNTSYIYVGYIEPDTSLLMAAGLGIAKAISSKQDHSRFAGEVMDDDTVTEDDYENDSGQVQSSKSCSSRNTKRESTNENDKMAAENNAKKTKTLDMSDGKKIIIMNFTF